MDSESTGAPQARSSNALLLFSVLIVATCGLIYELVAGTLASYLLGDSVTQFSLIIGVYLFSMGVGSYLSKFIVRGLVGWFIQIELLIGLVGGFSAAALLLLFNEVSSFRVILFTFVSVIGTMVGLEIPLLMAILRDQFDFRDLLSRVFSFDYIGALFASIIFPLVFVPYLGLIKTAFFFGIVNTAVGLWLAYTMSHLGRRILWLRRFGWCILLLLTLGFVFAARINSIAENANYAQRIIFSTTTPYQRIVLTHDNGDNRLYLNGNLQFSSRDEYRYHEALVHPAMQMAEKHERVLILGGGDGLAVREVLRYKDVQSITLVDLDKEMTDVFTHHERMSELNEHSLSNPKVKVINADALVWLKSDTTKYDAVIVDFPDPSNFSLGKLYSLSFYNLLLPHVQPEGAVCIQSTSPFAARQSYWCIENTLEAAGFSTLPYHCYVPSFGEWGFVAASLHPRPLPFVQPLPGMRFLDTTGWQQMMFFPPDMSEVPAEVNRLNNQMLVHYFERDWKQYE